MKNKILLEDISYIYECLSSKERERFKDKNILITGCAGFLGYMFMHFFVLMAKELGVNKIIGLDNFMLRRPQWIDNLTCAHHGLLEVYDFDVICDDVANIGGSDKIDYVIHLASIASPVFYRQYPIETLDANVFGLRRLLDFYVNKNISGFLFFSSSEIYGDPDSANIPTSESYFGNVSCIGPRACYDEAKRIGETICYLFANKFDMPISTVRPFNNYGPGMSINDKRAPADFAKASFEGRNITIYSDGSPSRTFCYVSDAIVGYIKALLYGRGEYFNIGIDAPEIKMSELAEIFVCKAESVFGNKINFYMEVSTEKDYLTNNPSRRCPNIAKAKEMLGYSPTISVDVGVERFLEFIKYSKGQA